jgi:N-acetylneuraminate synthase
MLWESSFRINEHTIEQGGLTYLIADFGSNHDGNLMRAKDLIRRAKDAGAHCAKFQHFQASKLVSAVGFDGFKTAHQRGWDKSVFEVYEDYSINPDWNEVLAETCRSVEIDFMTTPYDIDVIDSINHLVLAFKIGSGDITYHALIEEVAKRNKPVFLATGASTMDEVITAVEHVLKHNRRLCLMQCNTNYTGAYDNWRYINLNVLRSFATKYPSLPLGLSDHTPGHSMPCAAIALGACVIEKHFTDDNTRRGPDHHFAMTHESWKEMVKAIAQVEMGLGDGVKRVEKNEEESRIVQRRALRLARDILDWKEITAEDVVALRPCPEGARPPSEIDKMIGIPCMGQKGELL